MAYLKGHDLAEAHLGVSALNVHYRDVQHILGNVLSLWFFVTPIFYQVEMIPERIRSWIAVNPVFSEQGIGTKLLKWVEEEIITRQGRMLVANK